MGCGCSKRKRGNANKVTVATKRGSTADWCVYDAAAETTRCFAVRYEATRFAGKRGLPAPTRRVRAS